MVDYGPTLRFAHFEQSSLNFSSSLLVSVLVFSILFYLRELSFSGFVNQISAFPEKQRSTDKTFLLYL